MGKIRISGFSHGKTDQPICLAEELDLSYYEIYPEKKNESSISRTEGAMQRTKLMSTNKQIDKLTNKQEITDPHWPE